ncbi:hypothetical protein [Bradyrhizobium sp. AZCC 1693]|uniref:hypothetical protein n=1 Tax=Bradyrhizobium sp. AZCC 1693 TaxID=3117029 RepID=UPI002FF203CE
MDCDYSVLQVDKLRAWNPSGAIWYAHACCSAGSDGVSRYRSLFPAGSEIGDMLSGISNGAGAITAPMARALLGAQRPLRAFIGHVEPTFDWTLRETENKQVVTHVLVSALYDRLYQKSEPNPIGWALEKVYQEAGNYFAYWSNAAADARGQITGARDRALYCQLVAMDRQTTVILGDPTVSLSFGAE